MVNLFEISIDALAQFLFFFFGQQPGPQFSCIRMRLQPFDFSILVYQLLLFFLKFLAQPVTLLLQLGILFQQLPYLQLELIHLVL
jgi:hypothetical protein